MIWTDTLIPDKTILCNLPDEAIPHCFPYPDYILYKNNFDSREIRIFENGNVMTVGDTAGWIYIIGSYSTNL